jgi:hypothetical protein
VLPSFVSSDSAATRPGAASISACVFTYPILAAALPCACAAPAIVINPSATAAARNMERI